MTGRPNATGDAVTPYFDDGRPQRRRSVLGEQNAAKAACPAGHEYTPENIYLRASDGARVCRECGRIRNRENYAKAKAAKPEVDVSPRPVGYYGLSLGPIEGESRAERRKRLGREATRRSRARSKGEEIPKLPRGRRPGYEFTPQHRQRIADGVSGVNSPRWQGDSVSERGGRSRAQRRYRDIGPCVDCGNPRSERHHVDGNTANNELTNIKILCRRCHMAEDGRLQHVGVRPYRRMGNA